MLIVLMLGGFAIMMFAVAANGFAQQADDHCARGRALETYNSALLALKRSPNDADKRMAALQAGRRYSALTRDQKQVQLFDEIALKNDLDAACASAAGSVPAAQNSSQVRECPFCAELVLQKAKLCKHCKSCLLYTSPSPRDS